MNPKNDALAFAIVLSVVIVACAVAMLAVIAVEIFFPQLSLGDELAIEFIAGCATIGLFFASGLWQKVLDL